MRAAIILAAILFATAGPGFAAEPSAHDRFALWNECAPTRLIVVTDEDNKIGLTERAVATTARSRLRAARLYSPNVSDTALAVFVGAVGVAFRARVDFYKRLYDAKSGRSETAGTWNRIWMGQHGGDSAHILGKVALVVDIFIDEYLRVNESACAKR